MSSKQKKLKHNDIWAIILQQMLRNATTPKEETGILLKRLCESYDTNTYRICIRYITYILENDLENIPPYVDILADLRVMENALQVRKSEEDGGQKVKMAKITLKPWQKGYSWIPYMDSIFLDDGVGYEQSVRLIAEMVGISPKAVHEQYEAHATEVLESKSRYFEHREALLKRRSLISWKKKGQKPDLEIREEGEETTRFTRSRRRRTKVTSVPVQEQCTVTEKSPPVQSPSHAPGPDLTKQVQGYVLNLQYLVKLLESKHVTLDSSKKVLKDHVEMLHEVMNIIQCEEKSDVSEIY